MKYKVKFSGEFEMDCETIFSAEEMERARGAFVDLNPMLNAPGASLEITPVIKAFKISYRDRMLNYEIVEANNMLEASKIFNDRHFQTCMIEEIEEAKQW